MSRVCASCAEMQLCNEILFLLDVSSGGDRAAAATFGGERDVAAIMKNSPLSERMQYSKGRLLP